MKRSRKRASAPSPRRLQQRAAELAARVPLEALHAGALDAICARPRDERVAIACSGGADSVALLLLLWTHLPERRGRWLVLHFDHRLRGGASAADAVFVRKLAKQLGERCRIGVWRHRFRARGNKADKISEAAARDARWAFFARAMREAGARVIALGHQLDDVAETLLMRLARGSGAGGLAAPRPVQHMTDATMRVRPLLELTALELRSRLRECGTRWREDATNASDDFFRNRVRRHVLPALAAAAGAERDIARGFGDARALLEEDDAALEAWVDALLPATAMELDVSPLRGKPRALARRAVYRWFRAVGINETPPRGEIDALVSAIVADAESRRLGSSGEEPPRDLGNYAIRVNVPGGRSIELAGGRLRLAATSVSRRQPDLESWPSSELAAGRPLTGPSGDRLALRRVRLTPALFRRVRRGDFPRDRMAYLDPGPGMDGRLSIRAWRPGDRYQPLGASGRAKLQDLFVNRRVPRELRTLLPVVVNARGDVLWVPGLPIADAVAVQPSAKLVVQLTYTTARPMVHRSKV